MTQDRQIQKMQKYLKANKQTLYKAFAPTFCFRKGETSFPTKPETYLKQVMLAKYNNYKDKELDEEKEREYNFIKKVFITHNEDFNEEWYKKTDEEDFDYFLSTLPREGEQKNSRNGFLTFDERKNGYNLGEIIDIEGIRPESKEKAPIYTASIPTPDGALLMYQYYYAVSEAIPLTGCAPNLPILSKLHDLSFHYGDWEGVYIYVKINEDTHTAILDHMQTFAHGRDGARQVPAKDLKYDSDGHPCVFVGKYTHPSYASNFSGPNKFVDWVGNNSRIKPEEFIEIGDVETRPPIIKYCRRLGDTEPMIWSESSYAKDYEEYTEKSKEWNRYKPSKFWSKIYDFFTCCCRPEKEEPIIPFIKLEKPTDKTAYSPQAGIQDFIYSFADFEIEPVGNIFELEL